MRTGILSLFLFCCLISFNSCRTNKDLMYFRDIQQQEYLNGIPGVVPEYHLKINDNLYVSVQSLDPEVNKLFNVSQGNGGGAGGQQMYGQLAGQYLNGYHIDVNGDIQLPVLGKIRIVGLTSEQARAKIQEKTDEYLKDATVKLKLLSFKVTVLGEVVNPGVYVNYNNSLTVLEALSMASGTTDFARINRVLVMRSKAGGSEFYRLNLSQNKLLASEGYFLQPADIVYVEPHKYKNTTMNAPIYSLLLSTISSVILILNFWNN